MSKRNRIFAENSLPIRPSLCVTSFEWLPFEIRRLLCEHIRQMPSPASSVARAALWSLILAILFYVGGIQAREVLHSPLWYFSLCPPIFSQSCVLRIVDPRGAFFLWNFYRDGLKPVGTVLGDPKFYFYQRHLYSLCFIARGWLKQPRWGTAREK